MHNDSHFGVQFAVDETWAKVFEVLDNYDLCTFDVSRLLSRANRLVESDLFEFFLRWFLGRLFLLLVSRHRFIFVSAVRCFLAVLCRQQWRDRLVFVQVDKNLQKKISHNIQKPLRRMFCQEITYFIYKQIFLLLHALSIHSQNPQTALQAEFSCTTQKVHIIFEAFTVCT